MVVNQFSGIVGNTTNISLLRKAIVSKHFPRVSIMEGKPGTGKSTSAEILGLALTCANPIDGEPCLTCPNCKQNISALRTNSSSSNLVKKNMGLIGNKKDMLDLIREIFVLKSKVGNNVYIIEEAHVLSSDDQTALLEEIDRMDINTYIKICPTESYKLIKPLKSRARTYIFKPLNKVEARMLFDRTCESLKVVLPKDIFELIFRYSRGIPRDLTSLIDFIAKVNPSHEQLMEHLNVIDTEEISELFLSMTQDLADMFNTLNAIVDKHGYDKVLLEMKEYIYQAILFITTGNQDRFSNSDRKIIRQIFTYDKLFKISSILEGVTPYNTGDMDFRFKVAKIHTKVIGTTVEEIIINNAKKAAIQVDEANKRALENTEVIKEESINKTNTITEDSLMDFFSKKEGN